MKTRGLQVRFLLVMLASAAMFSAVTGGLSYWIGYQQQVAAGRQTIEDLVTAVEKTAAIGAFAADTVLMREVIDGLATHRLIAAVRIDDPKGRPLVRSGRAPAAADDAGAVVLPLMSPFNQQELTARLVIQPDLDEIAAQGRRQTWAVVGLLVLQVALGAGMLYLTAARFVSRPIVRLAHKLRSIQPGSDERLAMPRQHADDEIGMLIAGANALLHANAVTLERERHLRLDVERMEAQYRQIFDSTSAGIFLLDADGRLINGNPTVLKVMGLPLGDVQQLRGEDFLAAAFDDPEHVRELIRRAAQRRETLTDDLRLRERDGSPRWVHCLISVQHHEEASTPGATSGEASPMLVEGVMYDITDRKLAERRVRHQAEHDLLTGLKNRLATNDAIDRILAESKAGGEAASLLFIDLDGFKQVNDTLGHNAGDEVLRHCAERMHRVARRASDVLGRIGGDEFVVVLPRTGPDDPHGMQVAEALVRSLSTPIALSDGREAQVGVSIGMACYPLHGRTRHLLEEAADQALYAVKRTGKHTYAMALPSQETWADTRPTTEEAI